MASISAEVDSGVTCDNGTNGTGVESYSPQTLVLDDSEQARAYLNPIIERKYGHIQTQ